MLFKDFLKEHKRTGEKVFFTLIGDISKNGVISSIHDDFVAIVEEDDENVYFPIDSIVYIEI